MDDEPLFEDEWIGNLTQRRKRLLISHKSGAGALAHQARKRLASSCNQRKFPFHNTKLEQALSKQVSKLPSR